MPSLLFTKYYPEQILKEKFDHSFHIESLDFIHTLWVDISTIQPQIPSQSHQYIVTSLRAARRITQLDLEGEFYCVGKQAAQFLTEQGKTVVFFAHSAAEFLDKIAKISIDKGSFVYFCSDIRKDELPLGVRNLGYPLKEVVVYQIVNKQVNVENEFDAYVFFSPSGIKSFAQQYTIPKKAVIFALGETTGKEVRRLLDCKYMLPPRPDFEALTQTIKAYFDAEK